MLKDRDFQTFCDCLKAAALISANRPQFNEAAINLMFDVLSEYDIEQIQSAVRAHFRSDEGKFFPTPAHIIRQIIGSEAERAQVAWRIFIKAMNRYGVYESVRFPEPAFHFAIDMLGGWEKVTEEYSNLSDKELEFRRQSFATLYMRGTKIASWDNQPGKTKVAAYLAGSFENMNRFNGFLDALPPVYSIESGRRINRGALELPNRQTPCSMSLLIGSLAEGTRP